MYKLRADTVWTNRMYEHEETQIIFNYGLCSDRTPIGNEYHYLKIHQETWQNHDLVAEDLQVVGGFGCNREKAVQLYQKICAADNPVSPLHLLDIVQDSLQIETSLQPTSYKLSLPQS